MFGAAYNTILLLFLQIFTINHSSFIPIMKETDLEPGLYEGFKYATLLNSSNFDKVIFQEEKQKLWFVEFYKHWCGDCMRFSAKFKTVATIAYEWRDTIGMGTIDCANHINDYICRRLEVEKVPTLRIFHPNSDRNSKGYDFGNEGHTTIPDIIEKIAMTLKSYQKDQNIISGPVNLKPLKARDLGELWKEIPPDVNFLVVVLETMDSIVGSLLALDLSRNKIVQVRLVDHNNRDIIHLLGMKEGKHGVSVLQRSTLSPVNLKDRYSPNSAMEINDFTKVDMNKGLVLERKFKISFTDQINTTSSIPIEVNNFTREGINFAVRKYLIDQGVQIPPHLPTIPVITNNVTDEQMRDAARREAMLKTLLNVSDLSSVVFQSDIEATIRELFSNELSLIKDITGEPVQALKNFVNAIINFFPVGEQRKYSFNSFFMELKAKELDNKETIQGNDLCSTFSTLEQKYKPFMPHPKWVGCRGTAPRLRGYPCGMWTLMHTLVVREEFIRRSLPYNGPEALNAVAGYITHFFACTGCAKNFASMATTIVTNVTSRRDAVLWLWRAHNMANHRLAGDVTEDPRHHKVQFPTRDVCPSCHYIDGSFDEYQIFNFLNRMFTSITNLNPHDLHVFTHRLKNINVPYTNDTLST